MLRQKNVIENYFLSFHNQRLNLMIAAAFKFVGLPQAISLIIISGVITYIVGVALATEIKFNSSDNLANRTRGIMAGVHLSMASCVVVFSALARRIALKYN